MISTHLQLDVASVILLAWTTLKRGPFPEAVLVYASTNVVKGLARMLHSLYQWRSSALVCNDWVDRSLSLRNVSTDVCFCRRSAASVMSGTVVIRRSTLGCVPNAGLLRSLVVMASGASRGRED